MPYRKEVVDEALSWEGVKWVHQGRTKRGVDCVGLIACVAHDLGISEYDVTNYDRRPDGEFMSHFVSNMDRVSFKVLMPGDVVLTRDSVFPCHCGIIVSFRNTLHFLHAHASRRKVIKEPFQGDLYSRKIAAFRFRGLED